MIISKLLGSVLLISSALIVYMRLQNKSRVKLDMLDSYITFIGYIKAQIECYMMPIDKIIASCSRDLLRKCGAEEVPLPKNMSDLINNTEPFMDPEVYKVLSRFAKEFGTFYYDEQVMSCQRCIDELNSIKTEMINRNEKNKKVQLALCVCASFSLIIILM